MLCLVLCASYAALLWAMHDGFWYATDDGFYAHIAERVQAGDVLHRDVQDIHPGYIHGLHVLAFHIFGTDMVSLRYPLVLAALVQSVFTFSLLARRSLSLATAGTVATAGVGLVQFFSPNPNWYCLSLTIVVSWWLVATPRESRARLVVAGGIVGLMTMLRQLSGAWAAMGLLTVALLEAEDRLAPSSARLGRALSALMLTGLIGYVALTSAYRPGGLLLIASWPAALLLRNALSLQTPDRAARRLILHVLAGAGPVMAPMLAYHLWFGSTTRWLTDIVARAAGETQLPFFGGVGWYALTPLVSAQLVMAPAGIGDAANGSYWLALSLGSAANGAVVWHDLRRRTDATAIAPGIIAMFFAMVSLLLEGPLYLYYSAGATIAALLWRLAAVGTVAPQVAGGALALLVGVVGFVSHAGQPLTRPPFDILHGRRVTPPPLGSLAGLRASFSLPKEDVREYDRLVAIIRTQVAPGETLLVLPNDAQLYFLAERTNPVRFYNSALGMQSPGEVEDVLRLIRTRPPALVIFRPGDKYQTPALDAVMRVVRRQYRLAGIAEGREMYLPASRPPLS
ncbi:hypothetical protein LuPra_05549 [Luteitalea pratensis]|uniref:Glycosyltransferase RgtA/B/C/D-like domain-containing protein n=1 Tax=Luteitalea pratensis TaxID=1855912 RepID=A0A143PVF3_LUTPR|nr:hypothetical protein LuPra_05549 [Luteitalea pratensis]